MVFCQTRRMADQVAGALDARGFAVASVHGDLGQGQRERALRAFRNGKVDVLVATDVAARGLDVDDVTHVVNYECPEDDKAYLHRTGRTGRAGRTGIAVTFVDWRDMHRWKLIDESLGLGCPEPPETYSTSEHLFDALRIPGTATGTLPAGQRGRAGLGAEAIEDIGETGRVRSQRDRSRSPGGRGRPGRGRAAGGKDAAGQDRGTQGDGVARGRAGHGKAAQGQGTDGSGRTGTTRGRVRRRTRRGQDVSRGRRQAS
jgi:superfamily II DNA/RNA helicase